MYITPKIFESCKGPVSRRAVEAGPNLFLAPFRIFLMAAFSMGNPVHFFLNVVYATPLPAYSAELRIIPDSRWLEYPENRVTHRT
jgi:hypothetical protein